MKKTIYFTISLLSVFILTFFSLASSQSQQASDVFEATKRSVIHIVSLGEDKEEISTGTGFIIDRGILVTNYHLISQASKVEGRDFKGKKVKIEGILAFDRNLDIALLKIKSKAAPLILANSDNLEIGKNLFSVGGYEVGEIKVIEGTVKNILVASPNIKIFDTEFTFPRTFCGSPLLDSSGQVMGIIFVLQKGKKFALSGNLLKSISREITVTKFKNLKKEDYFYTFEGAFFAGKVFFELNDTWEAERHMKNVIIQNPDNMQAYSLLASIYSKQRNYSDAITTYQKIIDLDPNQDTAHMELGLVYLKMREWEKAIPSLEKAVKLNIDNKGAYFYIGNAYEELKEFDKAVETYKEYLKLSPKNSGDTYHRIGMCELQLGRFENAVISLQEAMKEKSQDIKLHNQLADAYHKLGQYDKAAEIYYNLAQINTEDARLYYSTIMRMYNEAKEPEKALEAIKNIIELDPNDTDSLYNLGYMNIQMKNYNEAIDSFKKLVEIRPDMEYAYLQLGFCYTKLKKFTDAVEIYKKMAEIFPDNADAWFGIGISYMQMKRFNSATEPLERAITLRPDNGTYYYNLAVAYLNLQDNYSARLMYNKLKDLDPNLARKLEKILR